MGAAETPAQAQDMAFLQEQLLILGSGGPRQLAGSRPAPPPTQGIQGTS